MNAFCMKLCELPSVLLFLRYFCKSSSTIYSVGTASSYRLHAVL